MSNLADQIREEHMKVVKKKEVKREFNFPEGVSTGVSLLNAALTGNVNYGFIPGRIVNVVGDSSTGKTFLSLNVLAEACRSKAFKGYRLIYADCERACGFDMDGLFGRKFTESIEVWEGDEAPSTVEEFESEVHELLDGGEPFIFILDSLDSISDEQEIKKSDKRIEASRKGGEKEKGDYGTYKAKAMSSILRRICARIEDSASILIIVSQTRDVMNATQFQKKTTRSGGRALEFYSTHVVWLYSAGAIIKQSRGIKFQIGDKVLAKVEKNKITGKRRKAMYDTYSDYGLDDIGSMVEFLRVVKEFTGTKTSLTWKGVIEKTALADFPDIIEERKLKGKLRAVVQKVWDSLEKSIELKRRPKYAD